MRTFARHRSAAVGPDAPRARHSSPHPRFLCVSRPPAAVSRRRVCALACLPQHQTIEAVLERGVKLDDLVKGSADLSSQSKLFYTQAKVCGVHRCVCVWGGDALPLAYGVAVSRRTPRLRGRACVPACDLCARV
jgi:hypothetical protein